ncbi:hypothetical protein CDAR_37011 [Caerostris darwini]|uniref:Uncharacterized protein n=1 Tax=Caerostris darwini TaxID=1538125 RepID=A0AAV4SGD3_9ARAC|nr:hypothetical protein CDAR_37011 [Caerostris darwini]
MLDSGKARRRCYLLEDVIPMKKQQEAVGETTEEMFNISKYSFGGTFRQSKAKMLFVEMTIQYIQAEQGEDVICWDMLFPRRSSRKQWETMTEEKFNISKHLFDSTFRQARRRCYLLGYVIPTKKQQEAVGDDD